MTAPGLPEPWVWLARIQRPQGRKGEVFAEILTDFPEKFTTRHKLWLLRDETHTPSVAGPSHSGTLISAKPSAPPPREVELTNHWLHKGGIVLHFGGVDSISTAEELKGLIVAIPRAERAELGSGEAYVSDLVGCTLVDVAGANAAPIGMIEEVDRSAGPTALLVVRGERGEILVPFAKSYLRRMDLDVKRVEMALPKGLVDLNLSK
jgi:16S rRNA processing protein RimM